MPTSVAGIAEGIAKSTTGGGFTIRAEVQTTGEQLLGYGNMFAPAPPPWESAVVISFGDYDQLAGEHSLTGTMAESVLQMMTTKGVSVTGTLILPVHPPGYVRWFCSPVPSTDSLFF
ncbi:hypothetical protein RhiJN_12616 [Ceratobasidium sp. AG-Ba]|nr:hypothetical protein RhiJN_12616 [Ceratobasidium sp. AG-Ba]